MSDLGDFLVLATATETARSTVFSGVGSSAHQYGYGFRVFFFPWNRGVAGFDRFADADIATFPIRKKLNAPPPRGVLSDIIDRWAGR